MTGDQKAAIHALRCCNFVPASYDKRFVRQMSERLKACPDRPLTKKQADHLTGMLHRYRRQHYACPCDVCSGTITRVKSTAEGLRKAGVGECPCGNRGTLFSKRGDKGPPRCAVCYDFLGESHILPPSVPLAVADLKPVPPKPYPWLGEERTDDGTMRRFCLSCGDCVEVAGEKCARVTVYPGFVRWYQEHIPCGADWPDDTTGPEKGLERCGSPAAAAEVRR